MWQQKNQIENVLLIDDDADDQFLFLDALTEAAPWVKLQSAGDVNSMLLALSRFLPDLIFLDINLPGADGFACLERLRTHPLYRTIPVVMFSSSRHPDDIARAYAGGARLYFQKQPHYSLLTSGLRKLLALDWMQPQRITRRHLLGDRMLAFNPAR